MPPMRRAARALPLMLLSCACARPLPAASVAPASPAPVDDECTLATRLVPGVPGSPGHLIDSDINPNGASELATLMRAMVADLEAGRAAVEVGVAPLPLWSRHRKMRCAWPTDVADRTDAFDAMAVAYLSRVRALDARPDDVRGAFNAVVDGCLACHQHVCTGPMERIEALKAP